MSPLTDFILKLFPQGGRDKQCSCRLTPYPLREPVLRKSFVPTTNEYKNGGESYLGHVSIPRVLFGHVGVEVCLKESQIVKALSSSGTVMQLPWVKAYLTKDTELSHWLGDRC